MELTIKLSTLGQVIAECWMEAEEATVKAVAEKYPDPEEEHITFLFAGELRASVAQASSNNTFADAFLADLLKALPELGRDASLHAAGLMARVNLHSRRHERYHNSTFCTQAFWCASSGSCARPCQSVAGTGKVEQA
jgi:hypothetical protein